MILTKKAVLLLILRNEKVIVKALIHKHCFHISWHAILIVLGKK